MQNFRNAILGAALCSLSTVAWGQGYQIQPMLTSIAPSGPGSRTTILIKNTGEVPITLELSPFIATVDVRGLPTRKNEDKDILIYPAQTLIPSGKEQSVQVRYIGDASLTEARMYGVLISQLPIDFAKGTTGGEGTTAADVKVSFNFLSHIIVTPPMAKSAIQIHALQKRPDGSLPLMLRNDGSGIALLNSARWTFVDATGTMVELSTDDVQVGDFSALLPHQDREALVKAEFIVTLHGTITPKIDLP
jgi:fimbrial chaperone protein